MKLTGVHTVEDYHDLHAYSVSNYTFWLDLWQFMGILSSVTPDPTKVRQIMSVFFPYDTEHHYR